MRQFLNKTILLLTLTATVLLQVHPVYASRGLDFYYYNPDSIQSNFSHLSKEVKAFLKQGGLSAHFQAFTQKTDFDRMVKEKEPSLVFVPDWYYRKHADSLNLTPLLVPLHNGKTAYTKVLLVRRSGISSTRELAGRTLAMTTMGADSEKLLTTFFKEQGLDFSDINIINTPKDADALYAVALGQVDAALVGKATLDAIREVNHRIVEVVEVLVTSSPVPVPLLCLMADDMNDEEIKRLKQLFMENREPASLPTFMKMLQINGWQDAQE